MKRYIAIILSLLAIQTMSYSQRFDGIDISRHQGKIEWEEVAKNRDIRFVYIKASEGSTYTDPNFKENISGAKKAGLKVGAYHYMSMSSSSKSQFDHFRRLYPKKTAELIPMIDVEKCGKSTRKQVQKRLSELMSLMKSYYGKYPMIYSVNGTYNRYLAPEFNTYVLYIGRYGKNPPIIRGKGHYDIWQYSEKGSVKGIIKDVDLCKFHKSSDIKDLLLDK